MVINTYMYFSLVTSHVLVNIIFPYTCVFSESVPEQTGPLITPAALPTLNPQQIQQLQMAKKYCQDITNKFVSI